MGMDLGKSKKQVIVYFAGWNLGRKEGVKGGEVASIPWEKVTSVNHAFWQVAPADGSTETSFERKAAGKPARKDFRIIPKDAYKDLEDETPSAIHPELPRNHFAEYAVYAQKYPEVEIMISVGGWTRCGYFSEMAYTKEGRQSCAASCVELIKKYPWIGGIDIDWEYPTGSKNMDRLPGEDDQDYDEGCPIFGTPEEDNANFATFMEELRSALDENFGVGKKKLTACAAGLIEGALANQDWPAAAIYLDTINIMTYDLAGVWDGVTGHASSFQGTKKAAEYLLAQGIAAEKICIGSPLYAIPFLLKNEDFTDVVGAPAETYKATLGEISQEKLLQAQEEAVSGFLTRKEEGRWVQEEAFDKGKKGWHFAYDATAGAPYLYNDDAASPYYKWFLTYENQLSLQEKLDYVKERGIGGIIVWECSEDTYNHDLIGQMAEVLLKK